METSVKSTICFGKFKLDSTRRLLKKDGVNVNLNPKTLELLIVLIENKGEVVSKNDLLDKVWADQFVEENNLTVHVAALRKALGEKKGDHRFIVTIPGRGYSFVAVVEEEEKRRRGEEEFAEIYAANGEGRSLNNPPSLIGRTREISEIENLLRGDDCRLLTLTGAGGSGKTSLARAVGAELSADFADSVFFIELAAVNTPELVVLTIANTLGVRESGEKLLIDSLIDYLRERRVLLILDNFEQILSAAPFLQKLLNSTAFLKILVTSRRSLEIDEEHETVVTPLALPPIDAVSANLNDYAAIELFVRRAQINRKSFVLTSENAVFVADICRRLDGLPLAIELAAARVKLLSPQSILERLENSLDLLTSGNQDLPARQRTIRGAIEWSYDLLDENEKTVFHQLSVFAGGFTIEAAEAVCGGNYELDRSETQNPKSKIQNPKSEVLDLLTSLAQNNLLTINEQENDDVRLQMLEVVREFAAECLEKSGEAENVRRIHSEFFLALAEEAEPHLIGENSVEWLGKLEIEINNFRAALDWSIKQNFEITGRIAGAIRYFWSNHNHLTEGRRWLEKSLEKSVDIPVEVRFKLINALAQLARNQGDLETAQKYNEEGLKEGRAANNLRQIAVSAHGLAAIHTRQGDFSTAQTFNEEVLEIARSLDDEYLTAATLSALGDLEIAKGETAKARPLLEESLVLSDKLGNKYGSTVNLINLGTVAYNEENYKDAHDHFAKSLLTAKKLENKTLISCSLDGCAAVAASFGNVECSAQLAGAADNLREEIGYEIELTEKVFREDYIKKVHHALDEKSFADAYQKGRHLDLEEAVAMAELSFSDKEFSEIIVETHKFERIIIDEEIEDVSNEYEVKQINAPKTKTGVSGWLRKYFAVLIGAILAAAAIGGYFLFAGMSGFAPAIPFANSSVKQLTTNGSVELAALSRDGKLFAYTTKDAGQKSLWLGYVDGGNHLLLRPAAEVRYFDLDFSPDGTRLYFSIKDDKNPNGALYKMPVSGGAAEKVLDSVGNFTLAPDGQRIAFGKRDEEGENDTLFITDLSDAEQQKVASFPQSDSVNFATLSWSPDGGRFAVSAGNVDFTNYQTLDIIEIPSGKIEQIKIEQLREISKIAWLKDGAGLIITAIKGDSWSSVPQFRIFHIELSGGKLRELTNDRSSYGLSLDLSENSSSLLTIEHRQMNNIWLAPSDDLSQVRQITFGSFGKYDGLWGLDFMPDGKIIYTNSDTESQYISQINTDDGESRPLTAAGAIDSALNVSNDGRFVVFHSNRGGGFDIWRMDADGGNAQQLTLGKKNFQPFVSADNRWVYYKSYVNKKAELRRVSISGGEPEILNDKETSWLSFSPDGKYFAASYITDKPRLAIFSAETNEVLKQFDMPKNSTMSIGSRWTPDSQAVAFRDWYDGYWIQPIDGGEPQKLKGLPNEKFYNFAWSKDGKLFAFVRGQEIRDVVLFQIQTK